MRIYSVSPKIVSVGSWDLSLVDYHFYFYFIFRLVRIYNYHISVYSYRVFVRLVVVWSNNCNDTSVQLSLVESSKIMIVLLNTYYYEYMRLLISNSVISHINYIHLKKNTNR